MREGLDQWLFVYATYSVAVIGTVALITWAWLAMRASERRRDEVRGQ